jgi:hypothetical protein
MLNRTAGAAKIGKERVEELQPDLRELLDPVPEVEKYDPTLAASRWSAIRSPRCGTLTSSVSVTVGRLPSERGSLSDERISAVIKAVRWATAWPAQAVDE